MLEAHGTTFLEENVSPHNRQVDGRGGRHGDDRGNNQSRGYRCGRGQGRNNYRNRGGYHPYSKNNTPFHSKWSKNDKGKGVQKAVKKSDDNCYKCGIKGHWSRTCCTPKHLVDLYQASLKEKGKGVEENLAKLSDPEGYLDASDGVNITHLVKLLTSLGI